MSTMDPAAVLSHLLALPDETEWIEWKENDHRPDDIGEYLSALSNAAALRGKDAGYIVWGIRDGTREVVGTSFKPSREKGGNEELENWLTMLLTPPTSFHIHEFEHRGTSVVLIEIAPAVSIPVRFKDVEYIRVGTYK